jgi:hypothetical protein
VSWRAFLLVFLMPALVSAQVLPTVPRYELKPIPPGDDRIVPLNEGKKAPFSGQLYDPATALRWANFLEQYRLQLDLCYKTSGELQQLERTYWQSVVRIEEGAHKEIRLDLQTRLERVEKRNAELEGELLKGPPWYETRTFGVVLGFVGGVGVVALSAWAMSTASR